MDIMFPAQGLFTNTGRENQPGNTTPDCLNVLPFDRDYRGRGAPRPGLSKFVPTQFSGAANPIQLLKSYPIAIQATPVVAVTELADSPGTAGVEAVFNGTFSGSGRDGVHTLAAFYWPDTATQVNLAPTGSDISDAKGLNAVRQVGTSIDLSGNQVGGYWLGSAASWTPLPLPGGSTQSNANGIDSGDTTIAGHVIVGPTAHAGVWKNISGTWTWTDLSSLIPGFGTTYVQSEMLSTDGVHAVGYATTGASVIRGFVFDIGANTATILALGPTGTSSLPSFISGAVIAGQWIDGSTTENAAVWETATPGTLVDMTPAGSTGSLLYGTNGTTHVGYFLDSGGAQFAAFWTGTSNVATEFSQTADLTHDSTALAIDPSGAPAGFATSVSKGFTVPVLWGAGGGIIPPIQREVVIVLACDGSLFGGTLAAGVNAVSNGTSVLSTMYRPQMASRTTKAYVVDTLHNLIQIDLPTMAVETFSPTAGAETASTLGAYSLACMWRDRLVFAASVATPQNFIMSRQGVPTDFDYGQDDSAAAVAGNASRVGSIGDPLNCLMPWTDDIMILGGDHSIYKVEGDIAAGGQIVNVSQAIGTLGPDCWDTDPGGNLYFVGTDGLYSMTQSGLPQNVSSAAIRDFFTTIDRSSSVVEVHWDRDRNGLLIFVTAISPGGVSKHLWYDATNQAFFPLAFADNIGPVVSMVYDGDLPNDRQVVLGGRDGYLRKVDNTALDDDGTDFLNYVFIGPVRPGGTDASLAVLQALEVIPGEETAVGGFSPTDWGMTITIQTGKDAFTALTAPQSSFSFDVTSQSRRKRMLQRVSGGSWYFKITGDAGKVWSLEKLVPLMTPGGLQRRY